MVGGPRRVAGQVEEEKNETWKERTEEDKEMPYMQIICCAEDSKRLCLNRILVPYSLLTIYGLVHSLIS